ncbi:MAG: NAD-dependent epimerase/dehydratase family protein [Candidatus Neomarinimicrobiota bacterium]
MRILVTGSEGFIGSFLTKALLEAGHVVSGFDSNPRPHDEQNYELFQGSILDRRALREAIEGVECVIHLAAEHKDNGIPEVEYFEVNKAGTSTVLDCASNRGVSKFVFFSSAAVYGQPGIATEENVPRPSTPYGASKLEAEAEVESWIIEDHRRAAIVIRPTTVFGPENYANTFRLISRVYGRRFMWIGSGENIKSVAYVENLVAATLFLMDRMAPGLQIYNYSDEPQLKVKQLVELISDKAQVRVPAFRIPYPVAILCGYGIDALGKILGRHFEINTSRLRKFHMHSEYPAGKIRSLGFHQQFTLEEGIEKTIHWYLDSNK